MINNINYNYTTNQTPSFKGLTRIFKKRIIGKQKTYLSLVNSTDKPFVGSLPKEIILKIKSITTSKEKINKIIHTVLNAFSDAADALKTAEVQSGSLNCQNYTNQIRKKAIKKGIASKKATAILTSAFQKLGLINSNEKIQVKAIKGGEGGFGIAFEILFPEQLNCKKKIFKIFKDNVPKTYLDNHGPYAEPNIALYISKHQGQNYKKSAFVETYLMSPQKKFIISEHADNYPTKFIDWYAIQRFLKNLNIKYQDANPISMHNIINNRIIDFGSVTYDIKNLSANALKVFKLLEKTENESIKKLDDGILIKTIKNLLTGKQKSSKILPFDLENALDAFFENRIFSQKVKNRLCKIPGINKNSIYTD